MRRSPTATTPGPPTGGRWCRSGLARGRQYPGPVGAGAGRGRLALADPGAGARPDRLGPRPRASGLRTSIARARLRSRPICRRLEVPLLAASGSTRVTGRREEGVAVRGPPEPQVLALAARYGQDAVFAWTPAEWAIVACDRRAAPVSGWTLVPPTRGREQAPHRAFESISLQTGRRSPMRRGAATPRWHAAPVGETME